MAKVTFYHAGCSVCTEAQATVEKVLAAEIVHLGEQPEKYAEAEQAGIKSVPALVVDGTVLHLNFGAALTDLRA